MLVRNQNVTRTGTVLPLAPALRAARPPEAHGTAMGREELGAKLHAAPDAVRLREFGQGHLPLPIPELKCYRCATPAVAACLRGFTTLPIAWERFAPPSPRSARRGLFEQDTWHRSGSVADRRQVPTMSQIPASTQADCGREIPAYFDLRPVSEGAALALGGPRSGVRTADPRTGTPTNGRAVCAGGRRTSGNPSRAGASRRLSAPQRASAVRGATPPDPALGAGKAANAQAAGRSAQPERDTRGFGALPAPSAGSAQATQSRAARLRAEDGGRQASRQRRAVQPARAAERLSSSALGGHLPHRPSQVSASAMDTARNSKASHPRVRPSGPGCDGRVRLPCATATCDGCVQRSSRTAPLIQGVKNAK